MPSMRDCARAFGLLCATSFDSSQSSVPIASRQQHPLRILCSIQASVSPYSKTYGSGAAKQQARASVTFTTLRCRRSLSAQASTKLVRASFHLEVTQCSGSNAISDSLIEASIGVWSRVAKPCATCSCCHQARSSMYVSNDASMTEALRPRNSSSPRRIISLKILRVSSGEDRQRDTM